MNAQEKITQRKAILGLKIEHCETKLSHNLDLLKQHFSPANLASQVGTELGVFIGKTVAPNPATPPAVDPEDQS
jgi:hypothetical protein